MKQSAQRGKSGNASGPENKIYTGGVPPKKLRHLRAKATG
jgi:hypothetical protein